jgi:hypothetical protein
MRNGLLLAVGALTLALLPAVTNASAPIFTDVPGVIVLNEDHGTTMAATNIFVFDTSVYDPDTDDADLAWSFVETDEGLTVADVDGTTNPAAYIFMTVDGIGAVADAAAARSLTAADANNVAMTASAMSLVVNKGTTGAAPSAVTMGAGTTNANVAADDIYTTIIIAVTDGVNATYKTVLVKSDYAASPLPASNRGGLYENIPGSTFTNANLGTALHFVDQLNNGIVTNGNAASGVQINTAGANQVFNPTTLSSDGPWGVGYFESKTNAHGFMVQPGYVYRLSATVQSVGATVANNVANIRMRMQPAGDDFVAEFVLADVGTTAYTDPLSVFNATNPTAHTQSMEALLQPPQEPRMDTFAYNTTYNYYLEYAPQYSYQTASVNFQNVVVDRFVIPQANSNGLLYYADTDEQWTTFTNANGTTETAPFAFGNLLPANPKYHSKGWRLAPRALTEFLFSSTQLALPYVEHNDATTVYSGQTTNVNDAITTIRTGLQATEGAVQVTSLATQSTEYKGTFSELFIGQTMPADITDNSYSLVSGTNLGDWEDGVYYRCTMSCKVASNNTAGKCPLVVLRLGTPGAGWGGNIEINEHSPTSPDPNQWTNYVTWVRGMPTYNNNPAMNMTIKLQIVDTNFNQGIGGAVGDNLVGGTLAIDTMSLEVFPASFWN